VGASAPAVALIGDAAAAQSNGLFSAMAVNALNALLGSVGKPGGILFGSTEIAQTGKTARPVGENGADNSLLSLVNRVHSAPDAVKVLLLYNANPVFATPLAWGVRDAFAKVPFIASFGSFIDETSAMADLILPDHSPLESWLDDAPSGSTRTVVSVAEPAMHPLHDTRAMPDVLLDVAHQLGGDLGKALPWKTYDEAIQAEFAALYEEKGAKSAKDADEFWKKAREQGGWWSADEASAPVSAAKAGGALAKISAPEFDGDANEFPFHFLPFASQLFYDGSLAHLPWMQEAPDPLSTVMWGTWVEINPKTAEKLAIRQGDLLEVASRHGKLRAPALVTPGIAPDVVAMPIGQGHENFTRFATGRGANPISILAPMQVAETGSLAWAATRVKVSAVGHGKLILFGGSLTEAPPQPR
jgi:anaerobic selenocysteine-containing dehydrogenase